MVKIKPVAFEPFFSCCVGRRDDFAVQHKDGRYFRVGSALTCAELFGHFQGVRTIGTYVIDEQGLCHFAVFDSDAPSGLSDLAGLQQTLSAVGIASHLELSRRGAHLWVFLAQPASPALVRAWLLPFCPAGVEFYPKQDGLSSACPRGSLVRLPLGVHRLTDQRYPFVVVDQQGQIVPVMSSLLDGLSWFARVERVAVPAQVTLSAPNALTSATPTTTTEHTLQKNASPPASHAPWLSSRGWCLAHDPLAVIGRYVELDSNGMGCCPFGSHHDDGVDTHPSFHVYRPARGHVGCWYCHTWQEGGSLFDFFRYYYHLDARALWHHILSGGQL
jgi:hypothetical protein